jgi:hypothetical protein
MRLDTNRLSHKPKTDELCAVYGEGKFIGVAKANDENELVPVKRFMSE